MVRGRRSGRRRLRPPLPEEREELGTPRYFSIIKGAGLRKEKELELPLPLIMPKAKKMPRPIPGAKRSRRGRERIKTPMPRPEKVPLIIRAGRYIKAGLVQPRRPEGMPEIPELNFPALYRRRQTIKTVTKVTDSNGKVTYDFPRPFDKIPEVIMTVKGENKLFGNVTETTLSTFTAVFFTVEHDHGGAVVDNGRHRPAINADGGHGHEVYGEINYTQYWSYGWLSPYYYTTEESDPGDPHHHNISNEAGSDHYVTEVDITDAFLWTSYEEDPPHYHTAEEITEHDHEVMADGGVLWKNSSVTITYMAQVDEDE